ncbi:MAG: metal-dependent hydrolase [Desulfomonilaceae bacterium]
MILGHIAIAGIAKITRFREENLLFLALASLGPDLVDKTANIFLGMPGRGMSHSLLFFASLIATCLIVWKKFDLKPDTLLAGVVMWASHIIGDFPQSEVLLWPFVGPLEPGSKFHLVEKLNHFYVDRLYPDQFWLEVFCIMTFFVLLVLKTVKQKSQGTMNIGQSNPAEAKLDSF